MSEIFGHFYQRASQEYSHARGLCNLVDAMGSGKLKGEMNDNDYGIAIVILSDWMDRYGRTFGLFPPHKEPEFIERCEKMKRLSTVLQPT